jgi:class 3 adenylate cyclase
VSLKDDLDRFVEDSFSGVWTRREGQKVPETDHLTLKNDALDLEATVLYADLADSTGLVKDRPDWFAAKVYKTFLYCAAKIIRDNDGSVTAYDGDRVMGVFIGASKNSNAAKAALQIRWAVGNIVSAKMNARYRL